VIVKLGNTLVLLGDNDRLVGRYQDDGGVQVVMCDQHGNEQLVADRVRSEERDLRWLLRIAELDYASREHFKVELSKLVGRPVDNLGRRKPLRHLHREPVG
jgi:hypothetical protein